MKIIQVNAWIGRLSASLARFIEAEKPDIICMQEAFKPRTLNPVILTDQFDFLKIIVEASGLKHEFFAPTWGFSIAEESYDMGNVILSRFPISHKNTVFTNGEYHILSKEVAKIPNTRALQSCAIKVSDSKQISILNYHGYLGGPHGVGDDMTYKTMQILSDEASKLQRPLIMAGDFNIWPISPALTLLDKLGLKNLTTAHDIKTTLSEAHRAPDDSRAKAACDYILISPEIKEVDFKVSELIVSDHKALILEFDL